MKSTGVFAIGGVLLACGGGAGSGAPPAATGGLGGAGGLGQPTTAGSPATSSGGGGSDAVAMLPSEGGSVGSSGGADSGGPAGAPGTGGTEPSSTGGASGGVAGASSAGAGAGGGGSMGDFDSPIEECATPSIDRFQQWLASGEGTTVPASGSLLSAEAEGHVAQIEFVADWCVAAVWLTNEFGAEADFSAASGFQLDYSSTSSFFIQMRPGGGDYSGGDQWAIEVPSSGGMRTKIVLPFKAASWASIFGPPKFSFEETRARASGFVFVGNTANQITFYGLRIDGYVPPCK